MDNSALNEVAFFAHLGGDKELGAEILRVYLVDAPARFNSLVKALEDNDQGLAIKFSHALKGISATIRAERVTILSENIEKASRAGDLKLAGTDIDVVQDELNAVLECIDNILSGL